MHPGGVVTALFGSRMAGATRNCCHLGAFCVHHTTMHHITSLMHIHIRKVHACLAVISHLHVCQKMTGSFLFLFFLFFIHFFWCTTAVTGRWNGYRSKSQRRRLTLEKKKNLPPLLPELEPEIFGSRVRNSNHWAIATPLCGSDVPGHTFLAVLFCFVFSCSRAHSAALKKEWNPCTLLEQVFTIKEWYPCTLLEQVFTIKEWYPCTLLEQVFTI